MTALRAKTTMASKRVLVRLMGTRENGAMSWLISIDPGSMDKMSPLVKLVSAVSANIAKQLQPLESIHHGVSGLPHRI